MIKDIEPVIVGVPVEGPAEMTDNGPAEPLLELCGRCGWLDVEAECVDSFGGTVEEFQRCHGFGASACWVDMSAVR